ncbi:MAG: hypothetical protein FWB91_14015 [Defluviitaleaceae bacterium]|nr:hypothetical protein [Defluviitaleaceae bacterium]
MIAYAIDVERNQSESCRVFVNDWSEKSLTAREETDAQSFQIEFFNIFGVDRKKVAVFENKVKLYRDRQGLFENSATFSGYIDLLWKGHILIEMKSPGKDLERAYEQAKGYALALDKKDFPKAILICDFVNFHYYNLLEDGKQYRFQLPQLPDHIEVFGDLAGYRDIDPFKRWDPVNIEAAVKMGELHKRLREIGYSGHQLELYLVRLLNQQPHLSTYLSAVAQQYHQPVRQVPWKQLSSN